ncbi:MAG: Lrp/AsnC family transcriptional regulator [Flavobacteriales bacterium]
MKLDKTDLKILQKLQQDGRMTNLQLSTEIGLSPAPTLERVKKLEISGVIKSYHAQVNEQVVGLGIQALVSISLTRQIENAIAGFTQKINNIPEIMECYQVTGNSDYLVRILVKDIPAFEALVSHKLSKIEEIGQMQTMVILSKIKDSKEVPLDY